MRAKKPLLLVAFVAILLAVLIIVPTVASAASGSGGGKPVNWATFVGDSNNDSGYLGLPGVRTMDAIHVQALDGVVLKGKYLDQFTGKPGGDYEYGFSSRNFESAYWDEFVGSSLSHAWFGAAADYPDTSWPTYWSTGGLPAGFEAFDADVADFVVYVPRDQVPGAWLGYLPGDATSLPVRYVLLDFGEGSRTEKDLYEAWIYYFEYGVWVTENDVLAPIPNGNIQVHVAAADF